MKNITLLFCIVFTFIACGKEEFHISNLNNNKIIVLGHGGMGKTNIYPMNSFESIMNCLFSGADGTEIDVQMTKDSVLVAYHDQKLEDNTNLSGTINSKNWAEIQNATYQNASYLHYSIVSLNEIFSNIPNLHSYKFTFDTKLYIENSDTIQFYHTYSNAIEGIIKKFNLENNIFIESEDTAFLKIMKIKSPDYKLFFYPKLFEKGFEIATNLELYGISISTDIVSKEQIEIAHANNLLVAVWSINSQKANKEAIQKNPDFIQTDKLENLLKLLE
jgi:glycerophosphoryl diester phosphodiesterase